MTAPLPSLYAQTVEVVRGILPVVFACAGFIALAGLIPDAPVLRIFGFIAANLAIAVTAYATCLFVLSDGAVRGNRALSLLLSGFGTMFVMAWILPPLIFFLLELVGDHVLRISNATSIFLSMTYVFTLLFLLARYGTVYPALVDGGDPSLAAAGERVPTGAVFWRLLGASLFGIGILIAITIAAFIVDTANPPGKDFVLTVVVRFAGLVGILGIFVAMTAVFCNAYRGAYGPRIA